ncbi:macrolide transporter subunit, membrane fusion protein (MFP) component [Canicola haemoglobinophilus]|uniref:Macrolide transporter subunit, membrane fusion protein (MFP) component n=1 Tax=Canicola haemoglobinophilus TaxID=733 RepID=A0A377HVS2_9PAST|nr:macrolide transporter subunit, membrane fusion protein (MFP) component [Canicola haemoglobinophilus]STO60542.1 macrolide transporter subunit, membrane fusion protein (MFP) component [Canicola haemoglobinophilus]STO68557.1 macrolide transporter subunit, membrane fusion protein (MFP) component [Canicola haemoglobinophilus]
MNNAQNTFAIAEAEIQAIQASIKQAEIDVNNAKTNLAYTKILSPISGTIISIPVSEGQTVNANQTTPTIVQVANLQKLLIKLEISEGDISKVRSGMKVKFSTLAEPDTFYQGVISSVDPAPTTLTDNEYSESISDTKAIYYYANVIIDNQDQKLRLGMTTQNTISITEVQNALVIPTITLQKQNHAYFVNVLNNDNQVEQREVEIGLNDDTYSEILSGLKEGEKVISSQLENGEKVGNTRKPRMF